MLIDCAPSLNALTRTAWAASDRVTVVTEPGLFSVAAADRALRAIEEIRRGLSPRLQPLGIIVNRARVQSLEHQFRIKELRDMFGPLVLSPQLPERTSLQQAQGAAKPLHIWPGESAQEMSRQLRPAARARAAHGADRPSTRAAQAPATPVERPHVHLTPVGRASSERTGPGPGEDVVQRSANAPAGHASWCASCGSGDLARAHAATRGELVHRVGRLRVELDERGLHLAQHLADGDAEDALAAADEVDDLVVGGAQVDARRRRS